MMVSKSSSKPLDVSTPILPAVSGARGSRLHRGLWWIEARARRFSKKTGGGDDVFLSIDFDPEDVGFLSDRANQLFRSAEPDLQIGSVNMSRRLLQIMGESFPSPPVADAYFANLNARLSDVRPLSQPGRLVIGLGTGRSGSTTLSARLAAVSDSCSTHENPPLVFWRPAKEQIAFHLRRFRTLLQYYELVADCAHWWVNIVDELVGEFPEVKFVGLVRDKYECAISFARVKGVGLGSYNHWAHHPNGLWAPTLWDSTYPTFDAPNWAQRDPDGAKLEMIEKYLDLYNSKLARAAAQYPDRFLLLPTKRLSDPEGVALLNNFIGVAPAFEPHPTKLNVRSTRDGRNEAFKI